MDASARGKLKVFLGYAAGVGKTYQMLEEARALQAQGADVVVGYFEPHGRKDTIAQTQGLELAPRKKVAYRDRVFEEMDTDAILARRPRICLVDEFPHTNVPGSERTKRWEDVMALLDAGIDVFTTMNIQHLESLNDQVWQITGIRVRETIPDWVVQQADEVVMVDLTPRALLNRLERGAVYSHEKARQALTNFFRESTLVALREMALRQTAHEVELRHAGQDENSAPDGAPREQERILIYITGDPGAAMLIRRAKRVADFLHADCFAVSVNDARERGNASSTEAVARHLNFARNLHIEVRTLEAGDPPVSVVRFARLNRITQIFVLRPRKRPWSSLFGRDVIQRIVQLVKEMQIVIVAERHQIQY